MTAEGMGLLCLTTTAFRFLLSFLADLACLPYWLLLSEERENRLFTLSPSRHYWPLGIDQNLVSRVFYLRQANSKLPV